MGRGRHNRADLVDGLLLLNKPAGLTSNQALQRVKRLLNARKAGHTGALDPAATGMLPLCFGEATKVCSYLLDAEKTYRVTARIGVATDTGDADGSETARGDVPEFTFEQWSALLGNFLGDSMQVPPMYSALKKDGKRLYELARQGKVVERDARRIHIESISLLEAAGARLVFRVRCSKGTYIRALVEDIAAAAGTVAHTVKLHREVVGEFSPDAMLDLTAVEQAAAEGIERLRERLIPPDTALSALPEVDIDASAADRFTAGQSIPVIGVEAAGLVRVYDQARCFLGIGEFAAGGQLAPRRVFLTGEKKPVDI